MKFFDFFKSGSRNLLSIAKEEALDMLKETKEMYKEVNTLLFERIPPSHNLYQLDKGVNKREIDIRKKVLEHLAVQPDAMDIAPALILTSVVIDIERIGDYCKNMFELVNLYPEALEGHAIFTQLKTLSHEIEGAFDYTHKALAEGDEEAAKKVMELDGRVKKVCKQIPTQVLEDEGIDKKQGIIAVLLARYLKRVSAHLWNISSSVINPFPKIGYHPESKF